MGYRQGQAPGDLDTEGLRKFTQEQLLRIQRATEEMEKNTSSIITDVQNLQTDVATIITDLGTVVRASFGVALGASASPQNVGSILVSTGTWDLSALFRFSAGGATVATDWISILSTNPVLSMATSITGVSANERRPAANDYTLTQSHPVYTVTFASPTTVYARAQANWSVAPAYSVNGWLQAVKRVS